MALEITELFWFVAESGKDCWLFSQCAQCSPFSHGNRKPNF